MGSYVSPPCYSVRAGRGSGGLGVRGAPTPPGLEQGLLGAVTLEPGDTLPPT